MSISRRSAALLGMAVACLVFPTVAAAGDCTPSLGDPAFVPTGGTSPTHIVVADFNGDGESDLAVCNSTVFGGGVASLAILLGNGTGAFGAPMTMSTTGQPHFIAAGDFNGDGILDLAVTLKLDLVVSIYRGLGAGGVGNGTFAQPVTYPTGGQPFQIVTGDYNEDGILDLAVAINNIPRVSVLRGLGAGGVGNGAFAAPVAYPLANLGRGIAQGDFNNDGILDLVATEWQSGTVGVLRGQGVGGVGNGTFAPTVHFGAGVEPVDLEVFDYNKDGILDLAVANGASAGTVVLRGQGAGGIGTGSFAIQATLPTGNTSCVIVIDVNEDGLADLLSGEAVAPVGRQLHLFLGNGAGPIGNGTWSFDTTVPLSDEPYQLAVTDLDGDGHEDALASGYQTDRLTTLFWSCRIPPPVPPDLRAPVLTRVRDVPADEGGRVYLTWLPSSLDVSGGAVTSYRIWRQIPDEAAQAPASGARTTTTRTESTPTGEVTVTFWEAIATLPAQRLEGYGYTAPTTEDSTAANPVSTAFFVSALTADPNVFYSSDVASGASIDNLAPQAPANFRTESAPAGSLVLAWSRNTEPDLERYHLYRSATAAFAEGETTLLDVESDTTYTDAATSGPAFYRVAAVDEHGNESAYSPTISTGGTVGVGGGPVVLALAGARPNPATAHEATLLFSLASEAPATLELYDVRGRRVAAPSLEGLGAGHHSIRIDRHVALAPGVYVVRLTQGGRAIERKIAITP